MDDSVNAQNINYSQPGAGAQGYGIDQSNIAEKMQKLWAHRNEEKGGSRDIWEAMVKNNARSLARDPNSTSAKAFQTYLDTGKMPAKISANFLQHSVDSFDFGLRATGHDQQNKANFLDSTFGKILSSIASVAAGIALPGVGGILVGSAIGGLASAASTRPSALGIASGVIGGGAAGSSGGNIAGGIKAAGGVGPYVSNAANSVGNFIQHPIASTVGAAKGLFTSPPNVAGATAAGATGVDKLLGASAGATSPALGVGPTAGGAVAGGAGAAGTIASAGRGLLGAAALGAAGHAYAGSNTMRPPSNLVSAANATAAGNLANSRSAGAANRIDQYTPFGSLTYKSGIGGNPDHWSSTVNLSPAQRRQFDLNNAISTNLLRQGNTGLNSVAAATRRPFDTSSLPALQINPGQTGQDAIMSRLNPMFDRQQAALDTQLANQGIARGSEAANNAYRDFGQQKNDAYSQAALTGINLGEDARNRSIQEQEFLRMEPLNYVNALRTGNQITPPQFQAAGQQQTTPGADIFGATQANYQNQLGRSNADAASNSNFMNGLFGLGSAYLGSQTGSKAIGSFFGGP